MNISFYLGLKTYIPEKQFSQYVVQQTLCWAFLFFFFLVMLLIFVRALSSTP